MPDHDILFNQLRAKIRKEGISPYVVWLKSKDCNSGIYIATSNVMFLGNRTIIGLMSTSCIILDNL